MDTNYLNAIALHGASLITHIGLMDETGTEITGGSYARQAVTWTDTDGLIRPNADLVFDIPAGNIVAEWNGFSAVTAGTNYGGETLTQVNFTIAGTYTLESAGTGINHTAV